MKKILILGFGSIFLFSCASEDKITTLQRELLSLRQEVNELKDRTDDNTEDIKNINARLDKLSQKVAENSADIEKLKMERQVPTFSPTPPQEIKKEGKDEVAVPQNDKQLYQYALDLYFKGNIEESRKAFTEFLKKYPDSDLYGNAIFWAGQTFYAEKKYKDAIDIWEIFLKKCDEGKIKKCNKYPDAMLKLGYSYIELGNVEKGKQYLQDLINKYPDSEPASFAKKKLEVLK
jgi:tol-pal system protein YbgF